MTGVGVCIAALVLLASTAVDGQSNDVGRSCREGPIRSDTRPDFASASRIETQWSLPAEGTYTADNSQIIAEPTGSGVSNGTIWLDPMPQEWQNQTEYVPAYDDPNRGVLDSLRGHGPLGMYKDPYSNPDADKPNECDEIDVGPDTPWDESLARWWTRDLELLAGVHGFKGPFDQGRNGNFGFHGGFNFGAPLGFWDWGWQIGSEVAVSNITGGTTIDNQSANRTQFFVTGGIFKRARDWGFQWGVVYDWLHDDYYTNADLKQIRSDTSFLFPGRVHEIGYFGAYGTGGGNFVLLDRKAQNFIFMETTDVFAFYYRRYFSGGGDGRIWLGWSGNGDGVLGGEIRVPMGTSWELQNRFNYLIPKQGNSSDAVNNESWGVTIDLVWYIGHPAKCERWHPYRPMLNVADNTLFMTNTFVPAQ